MHVHTGRIPAYRDHSDDDLSLEQQNKFLVDELVEREREIEHLQLQLHNSQTIGIAVGILMATRGQSTADAIADLTRASGMTHRPVVQIAEHVAATGALPR